MVPREEPLFKERFAWEMRISTESSTEEPLEAPPTIPVKSRALSIIVLLLPFKKQKCKNHGGTKKEGEEGLEWSSKKVKFRDDLVMPVNVSYQQKLMPNDTDQFILLEENDPLLVDSEEIFDDDDKEELCPVLRVAPKVERRIW
ncbi:hypothetical protein Ancab_012506 [Ancistrocladus abbreviatus]